MREMTGRSDNGVGAPVFLYLSYSLYCSLMGFLLRGSNAKGFKFKIYNYISQIAKKHGFTIKGKFRVTGVLSMSIEDTTCVFANICRSYIRDGKTQ